MKPLALLTLALFAWPLSAQRTPIPFESVAPEAIRALFPDSLAVGDSVVAVETETGFGRGTWPVVQAFASAGPVKGLLGVRIRDAFHPHHSLDVDTVAAGGFEGVRRRFPSGAASIAFEVAPGRSAEFSGPDSTAALNLARATDLRGLASLTPSQTVWVDPYTRRAGLTPEGTHGDNGDWRREEPVFVFSGAIPRRYRHAGDLGWHPVSWEGSGAILLDRKPPALGWAFAACWDQPLSETRETGAYTQFNPVYQCGTGREIPEHAPCPRVYVFQDSVRADLFFDVYSAWTPDTLDGAPALTAQRNSLVRSGPRLAVMLSREQWEAYREAPVRMSTIETEHVVVAVDDSGGLAARIAWVQDDRARIQMTRYSAWAVETPIPSGWSYTDPQAYCYGSGVLWSAERGPLDPCNDRGLARGEYGLALSLLEGVRPDYILMNNIRYQDGLDVLQRDGWALETAAPVEVAGSPAAVAAAYAWGDQRAWVVNWVHSGVRALAVAVFGPVDREAEALDLLWRTVRATTWEEL